MNDKRQTSMQIALQFGSSIKGSMGYTKGYDRAWGVDFPIRSWTRRDLQLEVEYRQYRLYCVNNYGHEAKWTSYSKWQPYQWTGGSRQYLTNRDFGCRYWRTEHQGNTWVSRYETVYFSGGMTGIRGLSWTTKQRTTSGHQLVYNKPANRKFLLCGDNDHAIYADKAKEV